jgi:replicative DNA helicase
MQPFVDLKLENRVLRHLIFDSDVDDKNISDEIHSNVTFLFNSGITKEIFSSEFRQWVFEKIVASYIKFSESTTKQLLIERVQKKYKVKEEADSKLLIIEKIFKYEFQSKTFKTIFDDLRSKLYYRQLFDTCRNLNEKLQSDFQQNVVEPVKIAQEINQSSSRILLSSTKFRIIQEDVLQNVEKDLELFDDKRLHPEKYKGILTGYEKIDKATGGWRPGELGIILGRPGVGKSILLLNFGFNAYSLERKNIMYITIEMPFEQQKARFQSLLTQVNYSQVKMPEYMPEALVEKFKEKLRKAKEKYKNNSFFLVDAPSNCNVPFLESSIISYENITSRKIDLLIVDPLYLMKPSEKTDDPAGTVSWELKLLARKMNIPVLAASQFNRESHKRHIHGKGSDTMDAAFSDKISNNADIMIGITGDKERANLEFPKSRDSLITRAYFKKDFSTMRFIYDKESEDAEEKEVEADNKKDKD